MLAVREERRDGEVPGIEIDLRLHGLDVVGAVDGMLDLIAPDLHRIVSCDLIFRREIEPVLPGDVESARPLVQGHPDAQEPGRCREGEADAMTRGLPRFEDRRGPFAAPVIDVRERELSGVLPGIVLVRRVDRVVVLMEGPVGLEVGDREKGELVRRLLRDRDERVVEIAEIALAGRSVGPRIDQRGDHIELFGIGGEALGVDPLIEPEILGVGPLPVFAAAFVLPLIPEHAADAQSLERSDLQVVLRRGLLALGVAAGVPRLVVRKRSASAAGLRHRGIVLDRRAREPRRDRGAAPRRVEKSDRDSVSERAGEGLGEFQPHRGDAGESRAVGGQDPFAALIGLGIPREAVLRHVVADVVDPDRAGGDDVIHPLAVRDRGIRQLHVRLPGGQPQLAEEDVLEERLVLPVRDPDLGFLGGGGGCMQSEREYAVLVRLRGSFGVEFPAREGCGDG